MNKYAVFGYPISHSKSPDIYNNWFVNNFPYSYYSRISAKNLKEIQIIDKLLDLKGFNLTSPLKNIYNSNNSINTVIKSESKVQYYNTDIEYFENLIEYLDLANKEILIIGGGESAKNIAISLEKKGLNFSFILRNPHLKDNKIYLNKQLLNIININDIIHNYDTIINTIKYTEDYLNSETKIDNKTIIDLIYQKDIFKDKLIKCEYYSGYYWLIGQAKKSFSYYYQGFDNVDFNLDFTKKKKHQVISLIGFMGSGKTTIGKILAEKLSYNFVDTDEIIIEKYGPIRNIFSEFGEEKFREMEFEALKSIDCSKNTIISTGGGIINSEESASFLEQNTFRVWLLNSARKVYKRIVGSDRPLLSKVGIFIALFEYRKDIYFENSDLIVLNDEINATVERLIDELLNYAS